MEPEPGYLQYSFLILFFFPLTINSVFGLVSAIVLVLLLLVSSAMISGSEVAYFSLSPNDLEKLRNENGIRTKKLLGLVEIPRKLLATILISNNFINIGIVMLFNFIFKQILSNELTYSWANGLVDLFGLKEWISIEILADTIYWFITIGVVTFLLVLFGEVAPKVYARFNNVKLAKTMSGILTSMVRLFTPLSTILVSGTNLIENRLSSKSKNGSETSREVIDQAIDLTVKGGLDSEQDKDMLKSIIKFADVSAKQIMCSRVDVIAVDIKVSFRKLLKVVKESGFSRIPVYEEDFDNVKGILYAKDLLIHLNQKDDFNWQELIRTNLTYVPESKKINDLLREFQVNRMHMGIVVDEYGGSSGIVTLEDIMEEIIGEITDEFDEESIEYQKLDEFNYIFEGKTLLNDFCRVVGLDTSTFDDVKGESDSVAGLVLEITGQIPNKGRVTNYNDFIFKVVSVSKRRIEKIKITLPQK